MLRLGALGMMALLAGCLASPSPLAVPVLQDDGVEAVAIRVEPLVHPLDVRERLDWTPCAQRTQGGCPPGGSAGAWDRSQHDFADASALFWRLAFEITPDPESTVSADGVHVEVLMTTPCGPLCVTERKVADLMGSDALRFEPKDLFLEPGETGVRLRIAPANPGLPGVSIQYHLQGYAAGFRAAGEPISLD